MNIHINDEIKVDEDCITAYDHRGRSTAFGQPKQVKAGARVTICAIIDGKATKRVGFLHSAGKKSRHQFVLKKHK